jgi:import inner membrane translocase subunit TIM22
MQATHPLAFQEACITKLVMSGVIGGGMGALLGLVMGSYNSIAPPVTLPGVPDPPKVPIRWQLIESWQSTIRKSRAWGRNFGAVGGVYAGVECVIEKTRAKHDMVNPVAGGCVTGAVLASRQGPAAMCFGCAGFALFSGLIELFMGGR